MRTLLPAVDLTPATTAALRRLQHRQASVPGRPRPSRRGVNLVSLVPIGDRTTVLDVARVAAFLRIPVPQIPALTRRGFTSSVRGYQGEAVFDHPVPRAIDPPPAGGAAADRHEVVVLHLAGGVEAGHVVLDDRDSPAGVGWMRIAWGGFTAVPGDPGDDDPQMQARQESRSHVATTLRCPSCPPVHVLRRGEQQTSASWRALAAGSLFDVTLVLPFAPVEAVSALVEAAAVARRQA